MDLAAIDGPRGLYAVVLQFKGHTVRQQGHPGPNGQARRQIDAQVTVHDQGELGLLPCDEGGQRAGVAIAVPRCKARVVEDPHVVKAPGQFSGQRVQIGSQKRGPNAPAITGEGARGAEQLPDRVLESRVGPLDDANDLAHA